MKAPTHFRKGNAIRKTLIVIVVVTLGIFGYLVLTPTGPHHHGGPSRMSYVMNNLRQIYAAAQQYMTDKHVTSCTYADIVGPGLDHRLHVITPVAGEDYTNLTVAQTMTQLTISSAALGTVTYSQ